MSQVLQKNDTLFAMCDCCGHAIQVERYVDDPEDKNTIKWFEFSLWERGFDTPMSFKERFRWIIHVLFTGKPWSDHVILKDEDALEVVKFITSKTKENGKTNQN